MRSWDLLFLELKDVNCSDCSNLDMSHIWENLTVLRLWFSLETQISLSVLFLCQTSRCVGEWERQAAAEDQSGSSVQAAYRHSRAPGPQHLQVCVCLWVCIHKATFVIYKNQTYQSAFLPQDVLLTNLKWTPLSLPANPQGGDYLVFPLSPSLCSCSSLLPEDAET